MLCIDGTKSINNDIGTKKQFPVHQKRRSSSSVLETGANYESCFLKGSQSHALAQLGQALRYKPESRGSLEFFHFGRSMAMGSTKKKEYQEYFLGW